MRFFFCYLIAILSTHSLCSQTLNGKIINGLGEEGLPNTKVEVQGFTTVFSDPQLGTFSLDLPGLRPGMKVPLDIQKEGYAVINREATQPRLPDNPLERIYIHVAPVDKREEMALQFYKISVERNIEVNFETAAKRFAEEANYEAIGKLHSDKQSALGMADSLAARLARFDPQQSSEDLTRAMQLYQQGNIDEALAVLDVGKLVERIEAHQQAIQQDIEALMKAADMALVQYRFAQAQEYYEAAVNADSTNFSRLETLCFFLNQQQQSTSLLRYSRMLISAAHPDSMQLGIAWNYYGIALKEQNRQHKAIDAYTQAMDIWQGLARNGDAFASLNLATALNNLGNANLEVLEYDKAVVAFEESLQTLKDLARQSDSPEQYLTDLALTLNNLGIAYLDLNRFEEAIKVYDQALEARRVLSESESIDRQNDLAASLNNIGMVYTTVNRYEEGIAFLEEALEIRQELVEKNSIRFEPDLAATLYNLGGKYTTLSRYAEGMPMLQEALELYRKLAEQNPERFEGELAGVLVRIGSAYRDLREYEQSLAALKEAQDIYRKIIEQGSLRYKADLGSSLNSMSNTLSNQNRFEESLSVLEEALGIFRRLVEKNPERFEPELAAILNNLGLSYHDLKRYEEAISAFEEALEIRRRLGKRSPAYFEPEVAISLNSLASTYYDMGQTEEAITGFEEALELMRKQVERSPMKFKPVLGKLLNNLGLIYRDLEQNQDSERMYKEALGVRKELVAIDSTVYLMDLGDTHYHLGELYHRQLRTLEAVKSFRAANGIFQLYPDDAKAQRYATLSVTWLENLETIDLEAQSLYKQAMTFLESGSMDSLKHYIELSIEMYEQIPDDSLSLKEQYNASYVYSTIALIEQYPQKRYAYQARTIRFLEAASAAVPDSREILASLVDAHFSQSWYGLFVEEYEQAEISARRTLELDPDQVAVNANLALSLLLQGKYESAQSMYASWADKPWVDERFEVFREVFLADLEEVEQAGLTHPDIAKIRELLGN